MRRRNRLHSLQHCVGVRLRRRNRLHSLQHCVGVRLRRRNRLHCNTALVCGCVVAIGCIATLRWCTVASSQSAALQHCVAALQHCVGALQHCVGVRLRLTRNGRAIACCTLYSLHCTARLIFLPGLQCMLYRYSGRCMWSAACCMLHVACCLLHVACCMLHVACCKLSVACCYAACCRNAPAGRERVQCGHRLHERAHELKRFVRAPSETGAAAVLSRAEQCVRRRPVSPRAAEPHCSAYGRSVRAVPSASYSSGGGSLVWESTPR